MSAPLEFDHDMDAPIVVEFTNGEKLTLPSLNVMLKEQQDMEKEVMTMLGNLDPSWLEVLGEDE